MAWILVKTALVILLTLAFNFVADAGRDPADPGDALTRGGGI